MITAKEFNGLNDDIRKIRYDVFCTEQGFENEFDDIDKNCHHLLVLNDNNPVGVCRFFTDDNITYHIGRVAVIKSERKNHIGSYIMNEAEKIIKSLGGKEIVISAQARISDFYKNLGFVQYGEIYYDEYCEHIAMKKQI